MPTLLVDQTDHFWRIIQMLLAEATFPGHARLLSDLYSLHNVEQREPTGPDILVEALNDG